MEALVPAVDDWIAAVLDSLPGAAVVPYPDWGSQTFQVGGKHFGRVGEDPSGRRIVTVKGDADENVALAQEYEGVTPGYYANKRLWISLALDADVPRAVVEEALRTGYAIVRASLTKKVQAELGG
ncbi:MmcQ/YjbR family DNA-binding protein [Demequina sp. TTPB684]|uniref:MmcQ/YjbR family DNA-binding protein n=1 Tax=unclassified Demequina TaxID=2620311 RepID=UPI001CF2798B|nr:MULTISPECIES: MmcQ/YjbR family DNA-binding protein [unclassified Demequina]MCB2411862.1 MmcQ/YjbR family DNA-binding protein [Demequina sp. TTPB684]UPU88616.1 MmcQ/YjbR family DNA-binding protein [Demequina sp. TMPB413]